MQLNDKVAVITGSTSGIGLGIAKAMGEAGARIVMNGLGNADDNAEALADVKGVAPEVHFNGANMMRPDEIANLIKDANQVFGKVDILVNNAGIQHVDPIEDFPPEKWDAILAINLTSSFHTIRSVVPGMKERGWGRIINVCSAHSLRASPHKAAYVAAKHGLAGLTKVVALELAEHGATANAISPGYVWTPLVEKQIPDVAQSEGVSEAEAKKIILDKQATGEFATVEQIGALAVFLASDAAAQINGANYSVDGGWTAQ